MERIYPLADIDLARRLERAEAQGNVNFVEARAEALHGSGSQRNSQRNGFRSRIHEQNGGQGERVW